jgi:hypothetical protein
VDITVKYVDGKVIVEHRKTSVDGGSVPVQNAWSLDCDINYEPI